MLKDSKTELLTFSVVLKKDVYMGGLCYLIICFTRFSAVSYTTSRLHIFGT